MSEKPARKARGGGAVPSAEAGTDRPQDQAPQCSVAVQSSKQVGDFRVGSATHHGVEGSGAYGVVYNGVHVKTGVAYAVKVFRYSDRQEVAHE